MLQQNVGFSHSPRILPDSRKTFLDTPTHLSHALQQESPRVDLLPLSHGDGPAFQFQLLAQPFNGVGGVQAHGEEADERRASGALLPGLLQVLIKLFHSGSEHPCMVSV